MEHILIKTENDIMRFIGRSGYAFIFENIQNNHLILQIGNDRNYKVPIPNNWEQIDLLEKGQSVHIYAEDRVAVPYITDLLATCYTINRKQEELFVSWRQRNYLLIRHAPDQYYTIYSTIIHNYPYINNGYDIDKKYKPVPHRKLGYTPLQPKREPGLINAIPCMIP